MAKTKESPKSGIAELEKTFQEYRTKLEDAEQESAEIISRARQKAESIIAEQQEKTQQIVDETERKAREEADKIILEAKNRAEQVAREADSKAKKEAKDRTKREVERIIANVRQGAEKESAQIIASSRKEATKVVDEVKETVRTEAQYESHKIIAEAKETAEKVDQDSIARAAETSKLLTEAVQKAESILDQFRTQLQGEFSDLLLAIAKPKDDLEKRSAIDEAGRGSATDDNGKARENRLLKGRTELQIVPPYDRMQITSLVETLTQIPHVRPAGEAYDGDHFSIYVNIEEPVPILALLREISPVASSDVQGDTIKLTLRRGGNGS